MENLFPLQRNVVVATNRCHAPNNFTLSSIALTMLISKTGYGGKMAVRRSFHKVEGLLVRPPKTRPVAGSGHWPHYS